MQDMRDEQCKTGHYRGEVLTLQELRVIREDGSIFLMPLRRDYQYLSK
jgi:hypothetical protein